MFKQMLMDEGQLELNVVSFRYLIGEDCILSRDIRISMTDSHSIIDINTGVRINGSASVFIGKHVWIGYHSNINKGVRIDDNSVVAGNSLVTNYAPSNVILAGIPAKVVKSNISWDRKRL